MLTVPVTWVDAPAAGAVGDQAEGAASDAQQPTGNGDRGGAGTESSAAGEAARQRPGEAGTGQAADRQGPGEGRRGEQARCALQVCRWVDGAGLERAAAVLGVGPGGQRRLRRWSTTAVPASSRAAAAASQRRRTWPARCPPGYVRVSRPPDSGLRCRRAARMSSRPVKSAPPPASTGVHRLVPVRGSGPTVPPADALSPNPVAVTIRSADPEATELASRLAVTSTQRCWSGRIELMVTGCAASLVAGPSARTCSPWPVGQAPLTQRMAQTATITWSPSGRTVRGPSAAARSSPRRAASRVPRRPPARARAGPAPGSSCDRCRRSRPE